MTREHELESRVEALVWILRIFVAELAPVGRAGEGQRRTEAPALLLEALQKSEPVSALDADTGEGPMLLTV